MTQPNNLIVRAITSITCLEELVNYAKIKIKKSESEKRDQQQQILNDAQTISKLQRQLRVKTDLEKEAQIE
jgi:hypothetical protein